MDGYKIGRPPSIPLLFLRPFLLSHGSSNPSRNPASDVFQGSLERERVCEREKEKKANTFLPMEHYFDEDVGCEEEEGSSGNFDCNICLDAVQDPVVTFCGHLFCWPCIYKWTCTLSGSNQEDEAQIKKHQRCPVCKAQVSQTTLVPIYGRSHTSNNTKKKNKSPQPGTVIPTRPSGPLRGPDFQSPRINPRLRPEFGFNHHRVNWTPDPVTSVVCEMVYERLFGNSGEAFYRRADHTSRRMRWRLMMADRSLGRIYFFLVCCMVLCLLLF